MYKMLLVEDEPIVRLALKSLVDWSIHGFDEVVEASNGKKALEIITSRGDIDIVITDINMPVMNGIELIEESRKSGVNTEFLVLSAYDDYSLVRSAFKLGIKDYILKTEMEPDKILKMVMAALESKKREKSNKKNSFHRNEFIKSFIAGSLTKEDLTNRSLRLKGEYYLCCTLLIDNFKIVERRYENNDLNELINSITNAINQVLEAVNMGEIISLSPEGYVIIFAFDDLKEVNIDDKLTDILSKIRSALLNFLNLEVTIGISEIDKNIARVKPLLEESQKNARLRFIYGKGKNIYPKDAEELNNISKNKNRNISQRIIMEMSKENGIFQALDNLEEDKCIEELKRISQLISLSFKGEIESFYIYYLEIVLMIIHYMIKDEENNIETIIGGEINFYSEIRKFDTIAEIEQWILELFTKIICYLRKTSIREKEAIKQAKYFIQNNFHKVTLDMVSRAIGFSKPYFSKIFTEETGENFTVYLTNVRIEKAKELLSKTEMKIYEVCDMVGYPNIEHFSRTFKKLVGVSPMQYKNHSTRRNKNEKFI